MRTFDDLALIFFGPALLAKCLQMLALYLYHFGPRSITDIDIGHVIMEAAALLA